MAEYIFIGHHKKSEHHIQMSIDKHMTEITSRHRLPFWTSADPVSGFSIHPLLENGPVGQTVRF